MTTLIIDLQTWHEDYQSLPPILNLLDLQNALEKLDSIQEASAFSYLIPIPPLKSLERFAKMINGFGTYVDGSQCKMHIPSEMNLPFGELPIVWRIVGWLQNHPNDMEYVRNHMQKIKLSIQAKVTRRSEAEAETMPWHCDENNRIPL